MRFGAKSIKEKLLMRTKKLFGKVISILLSGTMLAGTASAEYSVISTDDNSDGTLYLAETAVAVSEAWDGTIASEYAGGDGSESAPYLIANGQQLAFLSQQVDSKVDYTGVFFKLTADIVLNVDVDDDPIAWNSIGEIEPVDNVPVCFNGTFDGDNHKIVGMYQNNSNQHGLFAWIGENGTVKNVGVTDGRIVTSVGYIGNIAGKNYGTISNCYNSIKITSSTKANYFGGICGYNEGTIENCSNKAEMRMNDQIVKQYIGGICGYNKGGKLNNCSNTGKIYFTFQNYVYYIGGICGYNISGEISGCSNSGSVFGGDYSSGICAYSMAGTINDCTNNGEISGLENTAGVCGYNMQDTIKLCTNTGTVGGTRYTGGVCAKVETGDIRNCNNTGAVSGTNYISGVCGYKDTTNIKDSYNTGAITATGDYIGGICGYSTSTTNSDVILRCFNRGNVTNNQTNSGVTYGRTGGICGSFSGYLIKQCYNTGTIYSRCSYTGGVCGISKGEIKECYNSGAVTAYGFNNTTTTYFAKYTAGIVGYLLKNSVLENCYNTGAVKASVHAQYTSGLWGYSCDSTANIITSCYNSGNVTYGADCSNTYSVGNSVGQISNVYYDSNVCTTSSAAAWAKTTAQLTAANAIETLGFDSEKWSKKPNTAAYLYYPDLACFDNDKPKYFLGAPVPTGLKAVGGNERVTLTWDAMEDVESYQVYMYSGETSTLVRSGITTNRCTVTGLTNGVEVGFTVKSYVNSTSSDECSIVYATPVDVSAPTNVIAVPGIGEAKISWTAAEGATKYAVYYSADDSEYTPASDTVTDTSYTVTGLSGGQKYYFKVKAYGTGAWSDFSDAASADIAYFGVSAHSLLLGDDIGVKFYIRLADNVLADSTSTIKFTVNGRESNNSVGEADLTSYGYEFICPVAAAEMNDTITGQLYVGGQAVGDEFTYSVKTYADYILENSAEYPDEVPLVNAMLNYGAAAEKYFRGSTEMNFTKPVVDAAQLSAYKYSVTDNDAAYSFVGQVISLKNKVTAKLYFSGGNLTVGDFRVTQDGVEVDVNRLTVGSDTKGTYLAISDIAADKMGEPFEITVGGVTISNYSVFSYVQAAINSSTDGLSDVVSALYVYGSAAENYSKI